MKRLFPSMIACAGLALLGGGLIAAAPPSGGGNPGVFPPHSDPHGRSYGQWAGRWWKWALELPVEDHPFTNTPNFDVTEGQSGKVWNLAAPFGTVERTCTIPAHKSLLVGVATTEESSLEGFPTKADQKAGAAFLADHILVDSLFLEIDGVPVRHIDDFRFQSPQFKFTAPTPWIEGDTGGAGTSVADGYYVMLKHLHAGCHTLHFGGAFHFAISEGDPFDFDGSIDMTYHLTQLGPDGDDDDEG